MKNRSPRRAITPLVVVAAIVPLLVAQTAMGAGGARTAAAGGDSVATAAKKKCKKKGKKSATAAKKCKRKKKRPPVAPPPPPAPVPAPLTASEVIQRVVDRAEAECQIDEFCLDYGYYWETGPGDPACAEKSTYKWVCYGYNDEDFEPEDDPDGVRDATCDFREIVVRVGLTGISSQRDLTYADDGWDCFANPE